MAETDRSVAVATEILPQRWICLVAMVLTLFAMQFSLIITPGIAITLMPEMGLTPAQFGMLANMPYLCGVLFGIVMGNMGDRYGIKKMMTIALVVFILGAFWRAFSATFAMLMVSSLVMGFGLAVLNANSTKGIRLWFPGKSMGPAMGLYVAGASLGAGVALKCGPLWGTHLSYMVSAWMSVAAIVIWVALYRAHPAESADTSQTVTRGVFAAVMKNKNVWIVSLLIFFVFGNSTTFQTYLNAALAVKGAGAADLASIIGTISLISTVAVAAASILMPAIIARFKGFRPVMIGCCIIEALLTILVFVVPFGGATIAIIVLCGIFLGTMLAMGKTVPALLPGIDPRNLGAVGGLQSTLQNLGGWVIAGYIIAPIAQSAYPGTVDATTQMMVYGMPCYMAIYIGAAICSVLVAVCIFFLPRNTPSHLGVGHDETVSAPEE